MVHVVKYKDKTHFEREKDKYESIRREYNYQSKLTIPFL